MEHIMSKNNKIELNGFLGSDPKTILKDDKTFVILNVATTDSYPSVNEKTGEVTWKDKETVWHDVLVFRPTAIQFAKDLKKGDKVEISGSISYRVFKDAEGKNRKQATIIATYIEKIAYNKQENLLLNNVDAIVDEEITA
jgi:single-strand DNA-binding protein